MHRAVGWNRKSVIQSSSRRTQIMHFRLAVMIVCAGVALTGCAEESKPRPKRTVVHQAAPVAEYKKPIPVITQSITPLAAPTPAPDPTPDLDPAPELDPIPAEVSVEEQLKAAWKHICGLRNVEHVEIGRVNETEAQKHFIDEKCAEVRRDSHMQ